LGHQSTFTNIGPMFISAPASLKNPHPLRHSDMSNSTTFAMPIRHFNG
jgi:hypothetical protein